MGFAQLLFSEKASIPSDKEYDYASEIYLAGTKLLTLINDILDLSKVEAGTLTLAMEEVSLDEVFWECQAMIKPLAAQRGVGLQFPDLLGFSVIADQAQLRRALYFLLRHIVQRGGDQARIIVSQAVVDDAHVRITMRAGGADFSKAETAAMFVPFHRLSMTAAGDEDSGLGLPLAKCLVEVTCSLEIVR
jgi:signal transduction histidine kinase